MSLSNNSRMTQHRNLTQEEQREREKCKIEENYNLNHTIVNDDDDVNSSDVGIANFAMRNPQNHKKNYCKKLSIQMQIFILFL